MLLAMQLETFEWMTLLITTLTLIVVLFGTFRRVP